jgi:hypothetical protein
VKVASLVTLIKERLNIQAVCTPGKTGQFDVTADGERIAERGGNWLTRSFGGGYPDLENVIGQLVEKNRAATHQ